MSEINIQTECIERCNSMRHLDTEPERRAFVEDCALAGLRMVCRGPREGLVHPICNLPEETKQMTEKIVRPIMHKRYAALNMVS